MKYLLLIVVVAFVLWLMFGRSRRQDDVARRQAPKPPRAAAEAPAPMLACAHCGVHLPKAEALFDAAGHPYCGEPHRLAGPRR